MRSNNGDDVDRRAFLRRAGLAVGVGATLPLLGVAEGAAASGLPTSDDPDQLFKDGRFEAADRGYRNILRTDPGNAHANAQVGYLALLSNQFRDAEKYLSRAVRLASGDITSKQRLAECFVRQDQLARAIPLLRATGSKRDEAVAKQFAHISGAPWQVYGARSTRLPWYAMDPLPYVEASVNGGEPRLFLIDTYATAGLTHEVAEELGLRAVAELSGYVGSQPITMYLGVLESLRFGDIEIRNIPIQWGDGNGPEMPRPPDGTRPAGAIGTTLFYHFLTTMDYVGQALLLRRTSATHLRSFQAEARSGGVGRLPLWLAGDHFPCTLGSLRDYGPRIVTLDTGGLAHGLDTTVELAERAGIEVDYAHPIDRNGNTHYPITPDRISLGRAVGHNVHGFASTHAVGPGPGQSGQFGFDIIANFTHEFFHPFTITFDYATMNFYIAGGIQQ